MTDSKKQANKCNGKGKLMFTYGFIQLGSNVVSAISLIAIAFSLCSLKNESKEFRNCVEEVALELNSSSKAVRYCNGGN